MKPQLVLRKDAKTFIFKYEVGLEIQLLDAMIAQAKDRQTNFDFFDAAVLAYKLIQYLQKMDWSEHIRVLGRELVVCECGEFPWFQHHALVDVWERPELKEKVLNREINRFKCPHCRLEQELAEPFYYRDRLNDINIFVSPEEKTIFGCEPGFDLDDYAWHLEFFGVQEIVFGYDELLERLRTYED